MPQQGPTPKNDFWQEIVLPLTGVAAGTYQLATITVNEYGQILSASSGANTIPIVPNESGLSSLGTPPDGSLAVVVDDGTGSGIPAIYVYNGSVWTNVTGNSLALGSIRVSRDTFSYADGASSQIGNPLTNTLIIKKIHVTVSTPFSPGTTLEVRTNGGGILVASSYIDPTIAGVYTYDMEENNTPIGSFNIINMIIGGSPIAGAGHVLIELV